MVQLSQEEADKYRESPVVLNFANGFYLFPVSGLLDEVMRYSLLCSQRIRTS